MLLESFRFAALNLKKIIILNFLVIILYYLFAVSSDLFLFEMSARGATEFITLNILDIVLTSIFYAVILNSLLGITTFSFLSFFTYLRINILYSVFVYFGIMLFVLPSLYILTFFYLAPIIALEGNGNLNYFRKSKEFVKKSPWSFFTISILLFALVLFDFWLIKFLQSSNFGDQSKYLLMAGSKLLLIPLDIFLLISSIFIYRRVQED